MESSAEIQVLAHDKAFLPVFADGTGGKPPLPELHSPAAAAGDDLLFPLVADPHLAADAAADVEPPLVDRPAAYKIAAREDLHGRILALCGELHGFGKGDVLGDAADLPGILGEIEDPDSRAAVEGELVSADLLGLDDGGDRGFEELKDVRKVIREKVVELHRLLDGAVEDHFGDTDAVPDEFWLRHGIILSFRLLSHAYAPAGQNMPPRRAGILGKIRGRLERAGKPGRKSPVSAFPAAGLTAFKHVSRANPHWRNERSMS